MIYIYINPKGGSIESPLSLFDANDILRDHAPATDTFAHDLARKVLHKLSDSQKFWLIKKAEQYNPANPKPAAVGVKVGSGFAALAAMFKKAKETLKRPKIRLQDSLGNAVEISVAPESGKNAGFLYIKSNKEYAGKVSPAGEFFPVSTCATATKEYLASFAENPALKAKEYGRLTGSCCFCARTLEDGRSVSAGFGPICADKFGLPWGG